MQRTRTARVNGKSIPWTEYMEHEIRKLRIRLMAASTKEAAADIEAEIRALKVRNRLMNCTMTPEEIKKAVELN